METHLEIKVLQRRASSTDPDPNLLRQASRQGDCIYSQVSTCFLPHWPIHLTSHETVLLAPAAAERRPNGTNTAGHSCRFICHARLPPWRMQTVHKEAKLQPNFHKLKLKHGSQATPSLFFLFGKLELVESCSTGLYVWII